MAFWRSKVKRPHGWEAIMSRVIPTPFFPEPPATYNQRHMADVQRAFAQYANQMRNPGEGRHTELVLTNLQAGDTGLEVGALYVDGNTVKITTGYISAIAGVDVAISDGSVTVSTS